MHDPKAPIFKTVKDGIYEVTMECQSCGFKCTQQAEVGTEENIARMQHKCVEITQDEITAQVFAIIRSEHQGTHKAKRSIIKTLRASIPGATIDSINVALKELTKG